MNGPRATGGVRAAVDTFGEDGAPGPCDAARKAAESVVDNLRRNPAA
ncbi:hypothetical protein [Streptomyces sp. NA13]|nr:hypothetical protein [Streptomyces sp. NA13]WAC96022.1 hypothetical protein OSU72_07655 [Streptomyces sp. NA13]